MLMLDQGVDSIPEDLQECAPVKVFMPDLFRGKPFPIDKDGDKEEQKKFFSGV